MVSNTILNKKTISAQCPALLSVENLSVTSDRKSNTNKFQQETVLAHITETGLGVGGTRQLQAQLDSGTQAVIRTCLSLSLILFFFSLSYSYSLPVLVSL